MPEFVVDRLEMIHIQHTQPIGVRRMTPILVMFVDRLPHAQQQQVPQAVEIDFERISVEKVVQLVTLAGVPSSA